MKTRRLCKDFLRLRKGQTFDAIEAKQEMALVWGITVDWHEMANALVEMLESGEVNYTNTRGYDGMTRYIIN